VSAALTASLAGCGGNNVKSGAFRVPANIALSPSPNVSLDVGGVQTFTATAHDPSGHTILVPIHFSSSNAAVVTIANNGLACAGSWDSLTVPVVCTPGPVGVAQITATARGVSSPPTTVYVHQHVDSIMVSQVQTNPPPPSCVTKDLTANYEATAFSGNTDITSTVGQFTWTAVTPQVVLLDTAKTGLPLNQVEAKALAPGISQISASVSGTNSLPFEFTACRVQSIALVVTDTNTDSFTVATGSSKSITPTVVDSLGAKITGVNLTYCSSQPATAGVGTTNCSTNSGTVVSVATSKPGAATIIASCTPPACNIGFSPALPIYPSNVIKAFVTRTSGGAAPTGIVLVSTSDCGTADGCLSTIVPIAFPTNVVGPQILLPATPNSLVFSPDGKRAFMGTDFGLLGTRGLMVVNVASNSTTVQQFTSVTGKVLAVSPNGNTAIVSDTHLTPNQVFVFNIANNSTVALQITGATAAGFSPDGLKAYILASDPVLLTNTLYVYSTVDTLQSIPLTAPASAVSFLSEGAFAYIAGGSANPVTVRATCTNQLVDQVGTPGASVPSFITTLPNATQVLGLDPPNIDIINVTTAPVGCPPTVTNTLQSVNLGQGSFLPTQFIISPDGAKAYVIASTLSSILVFDIGSQTSSAIQLAGNATPLRASLTPEGTLLYVGASDNTVHALDTVVGFDFQQISFPTNPALAEGALCDGVAVSITTATQSGSNTIYTYTVTAGLPLQAGMNITIAGMSDAGNNGTFTITAVGDGTFTVVNPSGASASAQSGTGTVNFNCTPNLLSVIP
jgi:hypothetical protein